MNDYFDFEEKENQDNNESSDNHGFYYQDINNIIPPNQRQRQPKEVRERSPLIKIVALALICALIGGCCGALLVTKIGKKSSTPYFRSNGTVNTYTSNRVPSSNVNNISVQTGNKMTTSEIFSAYAKSVVSIEVATSSGNGAGTGFFISEDGYILTCYHVVEDATDISVKLIDSEAFPATYIGGDEDEDIAVIKISSDEVVFSPVILGSSDVLNVGDNVVVIGNALGTLANTTTAGIVSAKNRAITMEDGTVMNLLQTDCTINSGNSGGPLFNEYGEVVGIVNAKYSSSYSSSAASIEGIGFSIPISNVQDYVYDIIEHGYITGKPSLGISVSTVSALTAQKYKQYKVGAYVAAVTSGSCSEIAGVKVGDIITAVDGVEITSSAELIDAKNNHKAGEEMQLNIYRYDSKKGEGENILIVVTLDEVKPEDKKTTKSTEPQQNNGSSGNSNDYSGSIPWPFSGWPFF